MTSQKSPKIAKIYPRKFAPKSYPQSPTFISSGVKFTAKGTIHEAKGLRATSLQSPTWDPESKKIILTLVDLGSRATYVRNLNPVTALLPVDTTPGDPIIGPTRLGRERGVPMTETETRDKLEALQERLTTLRDSL